MSHLDGQPWRRPWDPPDLEPVPDAQRCKYHSTQCAYRDDDPSRCPRCHRGWAVVEGRDHERRDDHLSAHLAADYANVKRSRKRAHSRRLGASAEHEQAADVAQQPPPPESASDQRLQRPFSRFGGGS